MKILDGDFFFPVGGNQRTLRLRTLNVTINVCMLVDENNNCRHTSDGGLVGCL